MGLLIFFAFFAFVTSSSFGDALREEHQKALAVPRREHFLDATKEALLQCVGKGHCECWLSFFVPENGLPDVLQGHKYLTDVMKIQLIFKSWAVGSQDRIDAMKAEITNIFRALKEEALSIDCSTIYLCFRAGVRQEAQNYHNTRNNKGPLALFVIEPPVVHECIACKDE